MVEPVNMPVEGFQAGHVAAKVEKKSELYKTFPLFYKNENLPFIKRNSSFYKMKIPPTIRILSEWESWWGSSDEGHHIFSGEPLKKKISQYRVVSSVFFLFYYFFNYLRNAPDASVVMVDDERNTFYHHHGCVEAQSLRLVNAYLADKGIDGHQ